MMIFSGMLITSFNFNVDLSKSSFNLISKIRIDGDFRCSSSAAIACSSLLEIYESSSLLRVVVVVVVVVVNTLVDIDILQFGVWVRTRHYSHLTVAEKYQRSVMATDRASRARRTYER